MTRPDVIVGCVHFQSAHGTHRGIVAGDVAPNGLDLPVGHLGTDVRDGTVEQ